MTNIKPDISLSENTYGVKRDEWEVSPDHVVIESALSEGAFGEVHHGFVHGPLNNPHLSNEIRKSITIPVAIKMIKGNNNNNNNVLYCIYFLHAYIVTASGIEKSDFLNEIELMKEISQGKNTHVIDMIGCVTSQEPLLLLMNCVKFGDLLHYLQYIRNQVSSNYISI